MSKVSTETPSNAQQKIAGTDSTNAAGGGLATVSGVVRMTPAGEELEDWTLLSLTVAFIGESVFTATRAVSLRGPTALPRSATSGFGGGTPSPSGVAGVTGGVGRGGGGVSGGGVGPPGKGGGPTGAAEGGRRGGRSGTGPPPGGRLGKLIRALSPSLTAGFDGGRGGNVIRTVSFFGSFKSAME